MGRGIQFALILAWALMSTLAMARSRSRFLPSSEQFSAHDRASDCGVVQLIRNRVQEENKTIRREIDREEIGLRAAHFSLTQCAKAHGLKMRSADEDRETELANTCRTDYERWISLSYRVLMLEEESDTASAKRAEAERHLNNCPGAKEKAIQGAMLGDLF